VGVEVLLSREAQPVEASKEPQLRKRDHSDTRGDGRHGLHGEYQQAADAPPDDPKDDDAVAVAAMVDRLVHHAEVIVLKGQSYRLRGKRKEVTH